MVELKDWFYSEVPLQDIASGNINFVLHFVDEKLSREIKRLSFSIHKKVILSICNNKGFFSCLTFDISKFELPVSASSKWMPIVLAIIYKDVNVTITNANR